jgi:5S rRNA maturation endonuclease (ribonuclease M5)
LTDVLGYLNQKGLAFKKAGGYEVHLPCVFHGEDLNARGRLYINVDPDAEIPGLFMCQVCGEKGSIVSLRKHFGDPPEGDGKEDDSNTSLEIFEAAAAFYHQQLGLFEDVFLYLRGEERGIEVETIVDRSIGYAYHDNSLYKHLRSVGYTTAQVLRTGLVIEHQGKVRDSLRDMVTIPYYIAGNVVSIRGRAWPYDEVADKAKPKYKTCGGNSARLYNSDRTWESDEIIVCEGEFDCMVMEQLGFPAVGVPGARIWQDAWDGYLSNVRRVWLVFDRDPAGEQGAKKLLDKFGPKIKRVHLSEEGQKKDPTTWAVKEGHTAADFRALMDDASRGGLLVTVDDAHKEHSEYVSERGLKLGFELLDVMIDPGLIDGQVMVPLAKSGTGKTIWLLNVMQRVRMVPGQEDTGILFISLEQTRGEWFERARRIHRFYNLDATDHDCLDFWRPNLLIVDKNRLSMAEFHSVLDDYEYRQGRKPGLVCLDYVGYWARAFKGEPYQRVSEAIMALKEIAKERRIKLIAPHQVSRTTKYGEEPDIDSARDAGVIEETADYVLLLWSPDTQLGRTEEDKSGIVKVKIGKSRHGGRGIKLDLQLAPISLTMVPHGHSTHARMAVKELEWERKYHAKWDEAVYRHLTGLDGTIEGLPWLNGRQEQLA